MNRLPVSLAEAESRAADCVKLLRELVEIESPTGDVDANLRVARVLEGEIVDAGGRVERFPAPGFGVHLIGRFPGTSNDGLDSMLLLGHMDTVHNVGTLGRLPFSIRGGRVYGPGSYDMKGGLATSLLALRLLTEKGSGPASDLSFLITCDEERGSPDSRALIESEAKLHRAAVVVEPSVPGGAAKCRRKGVAAYELSVRGNPAHAGIEPERGASAVHELAQQITTVCGLARAGAGTTINVGVVAGGTRENVVAEFAHCTIDVRFWTRAEAERVDAALHAVRPFDERCTLSLAGGINRWALEETPESARLFHAARSIADELGFEIGAGESGGASDANIAAAVGCPTLDGLGPDGDGAHTLDEYILLDDVPRRIALMAALFHRL
ncbi:MAG: M20 family metallopeptidase [Gemmatimonadetes bacterium]|nr:M20 family metallopeptidase [Gemmatimonadota bacterium]MYE71299.1 M20 family metallopeptidase [Gemmatimonadota bacterium]MYJ69158.1 M20 family metallopeptidase [Gemmatimonadota bacterium]